jgi:hypothetical protein
MNKGTYDTIKNAMVLAKIVLLNNNMGRNYNLNLCRVRIRDFPRLQDMQPVNNTAACSCSMQLL